MVKKHVNNKQPKEKIKVESYNKSLKEIFEIFNSKFDNNIYSKVTNSVKITVVLLFISLLSFVFIKYKYSSILGLTCLLISTICISYKLYNEKNTSMILITKK